LPGEFLDGNAAIDVSVDRLYAGDPPRLAAPADWFAIRSTLD
tara:strand:+ start:238 stop:363 length:126 start_codon:yes stop_codon:yes gene_type:complete